MSTYGQESFFNNKNNSCTIIVIIITIFFFNNYDLFQLLSLTNVNYYFNVILPK